MITSSDAPQARYLGVDIHKEQTVIAIRGTVKDPNRSLLYDAPLQIEHADGMLQVTEVDPIK